MEKAISGPGSPWGDSRSSRRLDRRDLVSHSSVTNALGGSDARMASPAGQRSTDRRRRKVRAARAAEPDTFGPSGRIRAPRYNSASLRQAGSKACGTSAAYGNGPRTRRAAGSGMGPKGTGRLGKGMRNVMAGRQAGRQRKESRREGETGKSLDGQHAAGPHAGAT